MNEEELLDLLFAFLPETLEGWLGFALLACALVSLAVPAPAEDSHPAWKITHRLISLLGLGAGRLRVSGRLGKLGRLFGRKL